MTIVINDYNVEGSGPAIATKEAAAYIEEKSGGKIKCDLYIGGTMMEATDAFAGTAEGLADITFYLYSLNSGVAPLHELFGCFYYREMPDMVGMHTVINNTIDAVPAFREEFMKSNLYEVCGVPTAGSVLEFSDAAFAETVKVPGDLKGKLIQSSGYNIKAWAEYGVSGMGMPPSDWYTNLERGVCDALAMNLPGVKDFGLNDVTNAYLTFGDSLGMYCAAAGYLANLDAWNSWEPEVQALVKEAFLAATMGNCERDNVLQWEVLESEKAAGKPVYNIPAEEMGPWYEVGELVKSLYIETVTGMGYDGEGIIAEYTRIIDEYMAG